MGMDRGMMDLIPTEMEYEKFHDFKRILYEDAEIDVLLLNEWESFKIVKIKEIEMKEVRAFQFFIKGVALDNIYKNSEFLGLSLERNITTTMRKIENKLVSTFPCVVTEFKDGFLRLKEEDENIRISSVDDLKNKTIEVKEAFLIDFYIIYPFYGFHDNTYTLKETDWDWLDFD